ncbi:enoyl-CoA hydratase-related protein [Caballeronia sp. dw_19]|uniref:enoyl-CoA hydratase/isomerase family protein n=1 Tax=Caballeronia sp. dw_19 TaxID=2719791 RepID=UPI001BD2890C|nr:enoyl-CoA hydratase-related protein [Caballeronia sp. dw_19]
MPDTSESMRLAPNVAVQARMDGSIATVTIDRRDALNALSDDVLDSIESTFGSLAADPDVRVAVLRGAGHRAFASGADLNTLRTFDPGSAQQHFDRLNRALRAIEQAPFPVIAMIHGYAVGGGCELAAACDLRIAGSSARIGVPIGRLGHCADRENLRRLLRLIPPAYVKAMVMTDTLFDAGEALRIGFLNWVVPDAMLDAFTQEMATAVSQKSPLGLRAFKRAFDEVMSGSVEHASVPEEDMITSLWATKDFQEGVSAFFEHRTPRFNGS